MQQEARPFLNNNIQSLKMLGFQRLRQSKMQYSGSQERKKRLLPYILKNKELESSETAEYLGVTIAQDFSWNITLPM